MELQERSVDGGVEQSEALDERVLPAAWIGSRTDYEREQRYGEWVDLARRPREVMTDIRKIIDRTPDGLSQRWDICATRGLGGWTPTEHEGLPVVLQVATGVMAFGEHYGGLAAAVGADSPALGYERYQVSYLGSWLSARAFVEQVTNESGWRQALDRLPRTMRPYIAVDYRKLTRDARAELTFVEHPHGVWVYDPRTW